MSTVILERRGPVGIVTLNRPERLNAMSTGLCLDLHERLVAANGDPDIRVLVLTGAGRAFCAGDDLKEFDLQSATPDATVRHIKAIQQVTRDLCWSEKVVVGAVHGYAVGGGFEWLLNCDLVVAADDLVAFFPEMQWGQFVTGGVSYLLPQALGHQRAMELLVLGERKSAADLAALGLVNWVVPAGDVVAKALAVAETIAAKSAFSVGRLKKLLTAGLDQRFERALEQEEAITIEAFGRTEARSRVTGFRSARSGSS